MLVNWMIQAFLLAAILTGAALAATSALRMASAPARGVWAMALLGSFLLPLRSLIWAPELGGGGESGSTLSLLSGPDLQAVLARPASRLTYGQLVLEVGSLRSPGLGLARLAGLRSALERGIEFLLQDPRSFAPEGMVLRSVGGAVLAVLAFLIPVPPVPLFALTHRVSSGSPGSVSGVGAVVDVLRDRPMFTPYSRPPSLRNDSEMHRALDREYPSALRSAGVEGRVLLHVLIDDGGVVQEARLALSSGHRELDAAAIRAARRFSFWPALDRDCPTPVWISLPITFPRVAGPPAPGSSSVGGARSMSGPPSSPCSPDQG